MPKVTLFHTDGCHLCDKAMAMVIEAGLQESLQLCDIVEHQSLMNEYQTVIPVLAFSTGIKLYWPFSLQDILENK